MKTPLDRGLYETLITAGLEVQQLETVPFDPLEAAPASSPVGDKRTLRRKKRK